MERRFGFNTKSVHNAVSAGHYSGCRTQPAGGPMYPDKAGAPPGSLCDHLRAMDRLQTKSFLSAFAIA
jgi:hypothetical protein